MGRPDRYFEWREMAGRAAADPAVDARGRLRWVLTLFVLALCLIFVRGVQLEVRDGESFRQLAARPVEKSLVLAGRRGSILARDGTPLAEDREAKAVAVHFRYLQRLPDRNWLTRQARLRLSAAERKRPERVAAMAETIQAEIVDMHRRLAALCHLSGNQWQARTRQIERRVTSLAEHVNQRRLERFEEQVLGQPASDPLSVTGILAGLFAPPEPLGPPRLVLAEQTAYHRVAVVTPAVAVEIEAAAPRYPGVKIVDHTLRDYPYGSLAAHLVGHLGPADTVDRQATAATPEDDSRAGVMGAEALYEARLRGRDGLATQLKDRRGQLLRTQVEQQPTAGQDVVLSIDCQLQLGAEALLDRAIKHQDIASPKSAGPHGGAIVVLDIHSGELLALASAPRFDLNLLAAGDPNAAAILVDPRQPMFDRATRMAIAPGSAFKPLTALALVSSGAVDPQATFDCQGYLEEPDRLRCQIFRQQGIGHGEVDLAAALARSCNVYFFHHAGSLGGSRLAEWAGRFGFGQSTGYDLAVEAAGTLPTAAQLRAPGQTQSLAIGQGALTATPVQVARLYAAIANGGYLLTPRVIRNQPAARISPEEPTDDSQISESNRIDGLTPAAIAAVRAGLRAVVDDPEGTGYHSVRLASIAIAGKTGTAETGGRQEDHAWFAGYVPADSPRYAFVVVLEHGGSGSHDAGPLARGLVERMRQLGYFGAPALTADRSIPPGKG